MRIFICQHTVSLFNVDVILVYGMIAGLQIDSSVGLEHRWAYRYDLAQVILLSMFFGNMGSNPIRFVAISTFFAEFFNFF